jgi:hypothetical protein
MISRCPVLIRVGLPSDPLGDLANNQPAARACGVIIARKQAGRVQAVVESSPWVPSNPLAILPDATDNIK